MRAVYLPRRFVWLPTGALLAVPVALVCSQGFINWTYIRCDERVWLRQVSFQIQSKLWLVTSFPRSDRRFGWLRLSSLESATGWVEFAATTKSTHVQQLQDSQRKDKPNNRLLPFIVLTYSGQTPFKSLVCSCTLKWRSFQEVAISVETYYWLGFLTPFSPPLALLPVISINVISL